MTNPIKCSLRNCPRYGLENVCFTNMSLFCNIRTGKAVTYDTQQSVENGRSPLNDSAGDGFTSTPAYVPWGCRIKSYEERK